MSDSLKPLPDNAIIQLSSQQYNDLIMRVLRLENYITIREREERIRGLTALENAFGLPTTKEKRVR